ncbi:hypothetical protein ABZ439_29645 [Streptomyces sp. NPDC005840]|uniref:hypothetical protein n=1 Tax=Streptomyces sp. NPDC005840 TaxID=3157072 RepID=UPI0033DA2A79
MAGATYAYDHDASGNQVATLKDGAVTSRTQWDPNAPLPILATEYDSAWAVKQSYRYDPLGQPAATKTGTGAVFYYHHDTQGSPLDVTSSTGTLHQRWAYDPYGTHVLGTVTGGAPPKTPTAQERSSATSAQASSKGSRHPSSSSETPTTPSPARTAAPTPFLDKYLPVRPAYRLYRAEYMLRQQGCDALADLYA